MAAFLERRSAAAWIVKEGKRYFLFLFFARMPASALHKKNAQRTIVGIRMRSQRQRRAKMEEMNAGKFISLFLLFLIFFFLNIFSSFIGWFLLAAENFALRHNFYGAIRAVNNGCFNRDRE